MRYSAKVRRACGTSPTASLASGAPARDGRAELDGRSDGGDDTEGNRDPKGQTNQQANDHGPVRAIATRVAGSPNRKEM